MNSIYGTPLSGMQGAEFELDVTANNIANVNTAGFASVQPILGSLPTTEPIGPSPLDGPTPIGKQVGFGTKPDETSRTTAQAALVHTGRTLDIALTGPGFLTLRRSNGAIVYARSARLDIAPDGTLITGTGLSVSPAIKVPATVSSVTVDQQGTIHGYGTDGRDRVLGRLALVTFASPESLTQQGDSLFSANAASGNAAIARMGMGNTQVWGGYSLGSTTDLATEMTNMVSEERMFGANSKALQTLDTLVNTIVSMQQR